MNFLEEQGYLKLQVAGMRQGYRLKRDISDLTPLTDRLSARFMERENRAAERIQEILKFASSDGCRTQKIAASSSSTLRPRPEPSSMSCSRHCTPGNAP